MAVYITNLMQLKGLNNLSNITSQTNTVMQRLASGLRINSAKDDPAGLMISGRLSSEINGLRQANRNTSDGIAFAQTYEGALDETSNMLQRIRTLAVQSSNGTLTSDDRAAIQKEVDALTAEITRIAEQTTYGGKTIMVGTDSELLENGKMHIQLGPNAGQSIALDLSQSMRFEDILAAATDEDIVDANGNLKMSTAEDARAVLGEIDKLISVVNGKRGDLGAFQNRLESTIRVNDNVMVNLSDARSRIRDADYAEESAKLFQNSILQQSTMAMFLQSQRLHSNLIMSLLKF